MWQDALKYLHAQFQGVPLPQRDLWHGRLLEEGYPLADAGLEPAPIDSWSIIQAHERLARKPRIAVDTSLVGCQQFERGRYFGDAKLLEGFRSLASMAFTALQGGPFEGLVNQVRRADSPRDCSPCWVDVLYLLAERKGSPLLHAPRRTASCMGGDDPTNPEMFTVVGYTFLFQDLFTASAAAIDLLLTTKTPSAADQDPPPPPPERLVIDLQTNSATLNGCTYSDLDPDALQILKAIWEARGNWMSSSTLQKLPGLERARIDRILKKLPSALDALICSATGEGYSCPTSRKMT